MSGPLATVLICEDEPALRELIRISLDGDYDFVEAEDGPDCLDAAQRARPDLIVLDMMLPGITGMEVLRRLRRDPEFAQTPIVVLTAQPATREDALREGANLVLDKPFHMDEISTAVKEVLASSP